MRLTQMAEETGGEAVFPLSMKEIESAYDRVVAGIRAQYTLGYTSTNTARDGRWRRIEVKSPAAGATAASSPARATSPPSCGRRGAPFGCACRRTQRVRLYVR